MKCIFEPRTFEVNNATVATWSGGRANIPAAYRGQGMSPDRLIVITDEQSGDAVPEPQKGTKGYMLNVASARNGVGYGAWTHVDGFSEAIVDYIMAHEASVQGVG